MFLKFQNGLLAHHYIRMKAANIIYEDFDCKPKL